MIENRDGRRARRINPFGLTDMQLAMDRAINDPTNHIFAAWKFEAVGKYKPVIREVPATAKIAVSDDHAKDLATATVLAKTALIDKKFTVAEDVTYIGHDDSKTKDIADVEVSPL